MINIIIPLLLISAEPTSVTLATSVKASECEVANIQPVRFRGEPGTTPITPRERLPFTRPLDENLPPLKPLEPLDLPERKRVDLEQERHEQILREIEKRPEMEQKRDLVIQAPKE